MKYKLVLYLFFFLYILFPNLAFAVPGLAGNESDSLRSYLDSLPDDTNKVRTLLELSESHSWNDVKLAESYASQALRISEDLNYMYGLAYSKYNLSYLFKDSDLKLTEDLILDALENARMLNDSVLIGRIYNTIGNLKDNVHETDDALKYYFQALEIFNAIGIDSLKATVYNNLGIIYDDLSEYGRAFSYYNQAAGLNRESNNYSSLAINLLNMGYSKILSGDLDSALIFLEKSNTIATDKDYRRILPYIYGNLSEYYFKTNDYPQAAEYGKKAESVAKEQFNLIQEKNALIAQKDAYYRMHDLLKAYEFAEKINVISDSINSYNKLKAIDLLEMRYAFDKERKQRELESRLLKAEIKRKELVMVLIAVAAGLVILFFIFLYFIQKNHIRRKNLEQKNTLLEKEKLAQQLEFKNKELEYKSKELTTNVMYLLKKNEFIANISGKLKNIELSDQDPDGNAINKIIMELDRSVSEDNWTDFEVRFQEVHVDFYNKLSRQFHDLTPNELRLCAFLRLNMTSKEIAGITYHVGSRHPRGLPQRPLVRVRRRRARGGV